MKVVLVGDSGTGKTSLLNQYIHKEFSIVTQSTVRFGRVLISKLILINRVQLVLCPRNSFLVVISLK